MYFISICIIKYFKAYIEKITQQWGNSEQTYKMQNRELNFFDLFYSIYVLINKKK